METWMHERKSEVLSNIQGAYLWGRSPQIHEGQRQNSDNLNIRNDENIFFKAKSAYERVSWLICTII